MSELLQIGDIVEFKDGRVNSIGLVVKPYINSRGELEPDYPFELAWFAIDWPNKEFCAPHRKYLRKIGHINV